MEYVRRGQSWLRPWAASVLLFAAALLSTLSHPKPALAQSSDAAAARALFEEGRKLVKAGRYAEACPKFEESLKLDRGVGTQFNLADCWERLGRTASAWALFLDVAAVTKAARQADRERAARERAAALEPKLPRLVIQVDAVVPKLEIERDGIGVGSAAWGTAMPVDPGAHRINARAPGKKNWSTDVEVPDAPETVSVSVPPLEDAPASQASDDAGPQPASHRPDVVADARTTSFSGRRTIGFVLGGVGVVGLGLGTVFFLDYNSNNGDAKEICPSGVDCMPGDQEGHDSLVEDARIARTLFYVSAGAGAAALAAGIILVATAPSGDAEAAATRFVAGPRSDGGFQAGVTGVW